MQNTKKKAVCAAMLCMAMTAPLGALAETRVVTCGTLNLRAEATTDSAVLGKYGWGTLVNVKDIDGEWAHVSVGGQDGYMHVKYLGCEGSTNTAQYVNTNTRGLNLRDKPNGNIITSYPRGTALTVLATEGAWSKVNVQGTVGYMSSQWLSATKPGAVVRPEKPDTSKPTVSVTGTAVVNNPRSTQVLFLRSEPSIESKALGYYRNGKIITLLGKTGDWYKVSVDGKTGYMMAKFLKVKQDVASGTAKVYNPNGNDFVNFRNGPSLNAKVIDTVPVGTNIKVIEKGTDWTKAEFDGVVGYISTWFLKF